jgi:hypothetical protein
MKSTGIIAFFAAGIFLAAGCSLIDENLKRCEPESKMNYRLSTEISLSEELHAQLTEETDVALIPQLEGYLENVFSGRAHDMDLSFYDAAASYDLLHHEHHVMDAGQTSYSLYIPVHQYLHVALANLENNPLLSLREEDNARTVTVHESVADTLDPHPCGVFAAHLPINVEDREQSFEVALHMVNSAAVLALDTLGSRIKDIRVFAAGFATDYSPSDGVYTYAYTPIHRTGKVVSPASDAKLGFISVSFPSRDTAPVKADSKDAIWAMYVYATLASGSVTETKVSVTTPLEAGKVRVIEGTVYPDGSLTSEDPTVGLSITMDWTPGLGHEVVF